MIAIYILEGDIDLATAFKSVLPKHEHYERRQADDLEIEAQIKPKESQSSAKVD
jgi:hypothetical protein